MGKLKIITQDVAPSEYGPDELYLTNQNGELVVYATSQDGSEIYKTITQEEVDAAMPGGKVPVTLKGKKNVYNTEKDLVYTITNPEAYREVYTVSAEQGTAIYYDKDYIIVYTPPATAGVDAILINGDRYEITVLEDMVDTPSIQAPVANATVPSGYQYIASNFSSPSPFGHASSDWEIATDPGFTTIVASTYDDTTNLTTWQPASVPHSVPLYIRVRYKNSLGTVSEWSDPVMFDVMYPIPKTYNKVSMVSYSRYGFGESTAVANGLFFVSDPADYAYKGRVYYYPLANNYTGMPGYPNYLTSKDPANAAMFGSAIRVSADENWLGILDSGYNNGTDPIGAIDLYRWDGSNYVYKQTLRYTTGTQDDRSIYDFQFSPNNSTIFVCGRRTVGVFSYDSVNDTWQLTGTYTDPWQTTMYIRVVPYNNGSKLWVEAESTQTAIYGTEFSSNGTNISLTRGIGYPAGVQAGHVQATWMSPDGASLVTIHVRYENGEYVVEAKILDPNNDYNVKQTFDIVRETTNLAVYHSSAVNNIAFVNDSILYIGIPGANVFYQYSSIPDHGDVYILTLKDGTWSYYDHLAGSLSPDPFLKSFGSSVTYDPINNYVNVGAPRAGSVQTGLIYVFV